MVPPGEADYLVVLAPDQVEPNRWQLREGGTLLSPERIDETTLANRRSLGVALLGALSTKLEISETHWIEAIRANLAPKLHEVNLAAFAAGRSQRDT
jgi:indolepyruvate ferredoxin oxidoreductase beta subunit